MLGIVVAQTSPERFRFRKETAASLRPGDLIQVVHHRTPGASLALIEELAGEFHGLRGSEYAHYHYSCRLLETSTEDLVGLVVRLPAADALISFFGPIGPAPLGLGELAGRSDHIPVHASGNLLRGTHTCIFGSSGSGKSSFLGLLLEELLLNLKDVDVVVLDPNSDFASFDSLKPEADTNTPANKCAAITAPFLRAQQSALAAISKLLRPSPTVNLSRLFPDDLLALSDRSHSPAAELLLSFVWDRLSAASIPRTPQTSLDMVSRIPLARLRRSDLAGAIALIPSVEARAEAKAVLTNLFSRLKRAPVWANADGDCLDGLADASVPRFLQFDLGHLPFADRGLFAEKALAVLWDRNERISRPTFIVIDEAHHLAPNDPHEPWQRRTLEWVNRIAGEGRKYNLYLVVVSQRPAKIHSHTLDNCQNFLIMRLQNRDDIETLARRTLEVSEALLRRAATLRPHEAILFGTMTAPAMIRVARRRLC